MLTPITPTEIPWIIAHMQAHYPPAYKYLWDDDGAWYLANMYSFAKLKEEFEDERARFYRVEDEAGVYGVCKIMLGKSPKQNGKYKHYFYLQRLYLATKAQGKGIGGKVMDLLFAMAREQGCDAMWLETMEVGKSRKFYERYGFEAIDRIRLPFPGMVDELRGLLVVEAKL